MKAAILLNLLFYLLILGCISKLQPSPNTGTIEIPTNTIVTNIPSITEKTVLTDKEVDLPNSLTDPPLLQPANIDSPISLPKIKKYDDRVSMLHLSNVSITYPDAYQIKTRNPVYSIHTKQLFPEIPA